MALLQEWREIAYSQEADRAQLQKFWTNYFLIEKGIYEKLLADPTNVERGTVKELAEKFDVDVMTMVGFLDGINDSLKVQNPIEEMEEDTVVNLGFDTEMLYKNMQAGSQTILSLSVCNGTGSAQRYTVICFYLINFNSSYCLRCFFAGIISVTPGCKTDFNFSLIIHKETVLCISIGQAFHRGFHSC